MEKTEDLRITNIRAVVSPQLLSERLPITPRVAGTVSAGRRHAVNILNGKDDRLIVVCGPCSIHDIDAAMEYADRLKAQADRFADDLHIIMRVYFEKPRTTVGWKGLINDPDLNDSFDINKGLSLARQLLLDINGLGLPAGTEFLDIISPQYVADLIAWGAIGARTTESQLHRELTSGLSCPVGLKNGTRGNLQIAVDALLSASQPHHFLTMTKWGHSAIFSTAGNSDCHLILRGGSAPNYDAASVQAACERLSGAGLPERVMIDFSHANSEKKFERQIEVANDVAAQIAGGDARIQGVMMESHLVEGNQKVVEGHPLTYGQSITDACLGWEASVGVLETLANAVRQRRSEKKA